MAAPTIQTTATSSTNAAGANHTVTLPSGITAGDLILILMSIGNTAATLNAHADYTELLDENAAAGLKILYRWAAGGETDPTFVSSANTRDATVALRISGAENPATRAPEIGTTATGSSVNPNPPSVTPTGGSKDYLFVTFCGSSGEQADDGTYCTAFPTNYNLANLQKTCGVAGTNLGGMIAAAARQLTAASDDPGTFTVSENNAWRAQTIAVHPAALNNYTLDCQPGSFAVTGSAATFTPTLVQNRLYYGLAPTRGGSNPIIRNNTTAGQYDSTKVGPACIVKVAPGDYRMWYEGIKDDGSATTTVCYATSTDGTSWTKYASNPVMSPGQAWELSAEVSPNTVLYDPDAGVWKMWYHAESSAGGGARKLGYATSSDGITWTKYASNPVLSLGGAGDFDESQVHDAKVVRISSTDYRMWYMGINSSNVNQVGYATSTDGISWTKYNTTGVFLVGAGGAWDDAKIEGFAPIWAGDRWDAWYIGADAPSGYTDSIGHAYSTDGITWTRNAANPVLTDVAGEDITDTIGVYLDNGRLRIHYGHYNLGASPALRGRGEAYIDPILLPSAALLDDFNRASLGANYTDGAILTASGTPVIVGNTAITRGSGGAYRQGTHYNAKTFGPDVHVIVEHAGIQASQFDEIIVAARMVSPGTTGVDGYLIGIDREAVANTTWGYRIGEVLNNAETTFGGAGFNVDVSRALTSGDMSAFTLHGTALRAWFKPTGGLWTLVTSATDATYSAAGYVGLEFTGDQTATLTNWWVSSMFELNCAPGSFAVTGSDATFVKTSAAYSLDCQPGSFAVSGIAATLPVGRSFDAQPGAYTVTGVAATLEGGRFVNAEAGVYTVSGVAASVVADRVSSSDPGAYTVTGAAATLAAGLVFNAEPGSYTVTGTAATVGAGRVVSADPASYTLTGAVADLVHTTAGAYTLNAEPGSIAVSGAAAEFATTGAYNLTADPGAYAVTGVTATAAAGLVFDAQPGACTVTGAAATPLAARAVDSQPGVFTVAGADVATPRGYALTLDPGTYTVTGVAAEFVHTTAGSYQLAADPAVYTVTGTAATVPATRTLTADPAALTLTGFAATPTRELSVNAVPGTYTLTGVAVEFTRPPVLAANPASYTITGEQIAFRLEGQEPNLDAILTGWIAGPSIGPILPPETGGIT